VIKADVCQIYDGLEPKIAPLNGLSKGKSRPAPAKSGRGGRLTETHRSACGAKGMPSVRRRLGPPLASAIARRSRVGTPELSIVMPCLNEAKTVGHCVDKAFSFLSLNDIDGEVIVADNGSTDGSQTIATSRGACVIPVAEKGYGNALLAGIEAAPSGTMIPFLLVRIRY
jgi:hypothetical protein